NLTDERGIKAEGTYMRTVGMLRRYVKSWQAISGPLEKVAESLSDDGRHIKKAFRMDELVCLARLHQNMQSEVLAKVTRLNGERFDGAVKALEEKGLLTRGFSTISLTPLGEGIRKHLSEDPSMIRIVSLLDAKNSEENKPKKPK